MKSFSFDEDVAKQFGVEEAVVIRSFQYWINLNKANGKNYKDGRTWTFNTYESLAKQFPFWIKKDAEGNEIPDVGKMRRLMDSIIEQGVMIKNKYNRFAIDKTNWYAFNDESKWVNVTESKEKPLERVPSELDLFNKSNENEENLRLLKKADGKVSGAKNDNDVEILDNLPFAEKDNRDVKKSNPSDEKNKSEIAEKDRSDLLQKTDQYQLLNSSLKVDDREDKGNNDRDILPTNFNDPEDLDKKVRRLFRLFVSEAVPHFQNVDNVKKELIDIRPMLTRDVVWEIINEAFKKYPGLPKAQQSVNYLLGIVRGMKNDYVEQWNDARKKEELKEAAINRNTEMKREADAIQKENEKLALKASQLLTEHKKIFSASEVNKLFAAIKQGRAQYALGTIEAMLEEKGVKVEG